MAKNTFFQLLFLDDDPVRHDIVDMCWTAPGGLKVYHAYNVKEFKKLLGERIYDMISLDHDLGPDDHPTKCGCAAAKEVRPAQFQQVVVHSWNRAGADAMIGILRDNGVKATYRPFSEEG